MRDVRDILKKRKLVQWAAAYLAGAWIGTQLIDALETPLGLTPAIQRSLLVWLVAGLFVTLILAWFHGEKGPQRVTATEVSALIVVFGIAGGTSYMAARPMAAEAVPNPSDARLVNDASRPAIAVLPLLTRSSEASDRYFADGIQDELLTRLSQLGGLRVVSRTSAEGYRDTTLSASEIAAGLGVQYILEGGIQRSESHVRVNVQLIDALSDVHVWSDVLDVPPTADDLLGVQTEITTAIARELRVAVTGAEQERLAARSTDDPVAYDLYLRAIALRYDNRLSLYERHSRAIELLDQALLADTDFGLAYYRLGSSHSIVFGNGHDRSDRRAEDARSSLARAAELAPNEPLAPLWRAEYHYHVERDYVEALRHLDLLTVQLVTGVDATLLRAFVERRMGRWGPSLESLGVAAAIDPARDPHELGRTLAETGRFSEAEAILRANLERYPNASVVRRILARTVLDARGDIGEALMIDQGWEMALRARDWATASRTLDGFPDDHLFRGPAVFQPLSLRRAVLARVTGDGEAEAGYLSETFDHLEVAMATEREDARVLSTLGLAQAMMGDVESAVRSAERALTLLPVVADHRGGATLLLEAARTYAIAGDVPRLTGALTEYFSRPHPCSVNCVALDPLMAPLMERSEVRAVLDQARRSIGERTAG